MTQAELLQLIDQAAAEGWTELDLSGQGLTELPPEIGKLTQLETLILGRWHRDDGIEVIDGRSMWKVSGNSLTTLPVEISKLQSLRTLNISGNSFKTIPAYIYQLKKLKKLIGVRINLKEIHDDIVSLKNLELIDFTNNEIERIPDFISYFKKLNKIYLGSNYIKEIPEQLSRLQEIEEFYLFENKFSEIPETLFHLHSLKQLGINDNQINFIPEDICQLSKLEILYLGGNSLGMAPECIFNLKELRKLSLYEAQIEEVPGNISKLKNLESIHFGWNKIHDIPESITQLVGIRSLNFSGNRISAIPEEITRLKNLKFFIVDDNEITEIPDFLAQLKELSRLSVKRNKITKIPFILTRIPLKIFDVRGNPLPISPEILGPSDLRKDPGSVKDIFNYLERLDGGKVKPLNEAKLLLVGQGSVGKTSLIKRLMEDTFNPQEAQTDGLAVREWGVHVNSKDVRLNVWDFGGQEIYHATHQFFLTKRSLYILVCNCRTSEEENRIEYWLKLIKSFGGESPVVIVGNKSDEQPLDINRKALREKYPNICAILETSCQTGQGIEELRATITKEVGKLREVYNLLPLSWFQVKEQLEALAKDFISYGEYIGICYQNQIPEEHNQTQLIELLHNLGLVLNFRNHPFLQNTNVLNPDWVTTGIYTLLSDDPLKTQGKGLLDNDDLSRVMPPERYPPERHRYLTELMQEFQLCFELPDCPCPRFLIPGLLPKEEPEDTRLEGDTLEFQYHYRILPESVLSRFIVLSHDKIHNHIHWRSGVMLAYREGDEVYNMARIKADPEDKKIFIAIAGRDTTRRVFLSLIRDTFTKIHKSFADLEVSEWVPVPGHPDHPPLDYQELLGLEGMGIVDYPIGKLRIKVNLRQLLDGYESVEARHRQRHSDKWGDRELWDDRLPGGLDRESNRKPAIPQERTKLRQFVLGLPDSQVNAVIFDLNPPKGNVPPPSSPKSERVTALFEWLESSIGPDLAALKAALAKVL